MNSGSKNPGSILGKDWPSKCSNDPDVIESWPADCNIGVLLGSNSGIIDLEFDSDLGERLINDWMDDAGHPPTPTYKSAKSVHRLFKWEDKFSLERANFGHRGVEFRFGNNVAQSVIPPSLHESGVQYEWLPGLSPWEVEVAPLPDSIYKNYLIMRASQEKATAKAVKVDPRHYAGNTLLTKARNWIEENMQWETILLAAGWKFIQNCGDASDWRRPGKTSGLHSATVNFGGSKTLHVFSTSCDPLKANSSYDKFAYLCLMKYEDNPVKTAFGEVPEAVLGPKPRNADISLGRNAQKTAIPTPAADMPAEDAERTQTGQETDAESAESAESEPAGVAKSDAQSDEKRTQTDTSATSSAEEKPAKPAQNGNLKNKPSITASEEPYVDNNDEYNTTLDFMEEIIPQTGLIREVYDYYVQVAQYPSPIMGLATSLSFCQTLFGRRIRSHTDLRTNDYMVIMAPTGAGKEACEKTIFKLGKAAGHEMMHASDMQSGNGLLAAVHELPRGLWVCDEFGKMLEGMADPKANPHVKKINENLLKLYSKASTEYGGSGHAGGVRSKTQQPHLGVLGLTTSLVFNSITVTMVDEGLIGRIAFFNCQQRPDANYHPITEPPESLIEKIKEWSEWNPMTPGNVSTTPATVTIEMNEEALLRWEGHRDEIRRRMNKEGELRAAIWCRVAERTMKLALTHRAARYFGNPGGDDWNFVQIEMKDVDWGIKLSNYIANSACRLLLEELKDTQHEAARNKIVSAINDKGTVTLATLLKNTSRMTSGQFQAAAASLVKDNIITIAYEKPATGGRTKTVYKRKQND